jgi:hypothetical protein
MARGVRVRLTVLTVAAVALFLCVTPTSRSAVEALPNRIDDRTFWSLISEFSEPNGSFRSDNLVSNETAYQQVIPDLQAQLTPVSAYLGVGPDQNFTYIAALKPRISFIVDIRRQNMLLHMMYKAMIELSPTRGEFLARLFCRTPIVNVPLNATADALLTAFHDIDPDPVAYERNWQDLRRLLLHDHGFGLTTEDMGGVEYVYRAFYSAGPDLRYSFGRGSGWQPFPSYRDLMVEHDLGGVERSYLASEANYATLRDLEMRNLIVPIVGDFGGPKALRSVARYLDMHHATVSVFYTSNVEQYLFHGDVYQHFYDNVGALPIDGRSTFIRAFFNNQGRVFRYPPQTPSGPNSFGPPGAPRSDTLVNPISVLLAAYAEGHITSYFDVIDLSR